MSCLRSAASSLVPWVPTSATRAAIAAKISRASAMGQSHDQRDEGGPSNELVAACDALLPKAPVVIYLAGRTERTCVARAAVAVRVGTGRVTRATHAARRAHAGADHRGVEGGSPCPGSQVERLKRDARRLAARRELEVATRGAKALGVLVLAGRADDEHRHRCAHGLAVERELKRETA
eukprot:scaffold25733_cov67-Phaeocystis_antarctica.AAC.3